jgi:hypothetical protein
MKPERRIEKLLRQINVVPDVERKRLSLEELLGVRDKTKKTTSAEASPTIRRYIMNKQIWKIAAVLIVAATVVGVIGILQNGDQTAYAFEQTVAAMQGKRSFHIRTYYITPTRCKDEFWAEFDENGQVVRVHQKEWLGEKYPQVEVIWENQIKYQYELDDRRKERGEPGVLLISNKKHHVDEDDLEEFDPEKLMERIYDQIEDGEATVEVSDLLSQVGHIAVEVTEKNERQWRRVLLVDPKTDLVLRMDTYEPYEPEDPNDEDYDDESYVEGNYRYLFGIEVLEYNKTLDPKIFQANFPADTIIIDQTARAVGMAQGDLSNEEVASQLIRRALEAWAAGDYDTAGQLFGGAPKEFFLARASEKPVSDIVFEEPEWCPLEPNRPRYRIICSYVAEREGRLITTKEYYCVTTVAGQPGRWFVTPIKI